MSKLHPSRWFFIAIFAAAIGAGLWWQDASPGTGAQGFVSIADRNAGARQWYCVGGQAKADQPGNASVALSNRSDETRQARFLLASDDRRSGAKSVDVPGNTVVTVKLQSMLAGQFVATTIDIDGDGVSADLVVNTDSGISVSPCISSLGGSFYFADGSTQRDGEATNQRDNRTFISLYNPTADPIGVTIDAVVLDAQKEPKEAEAALIEESRAPVQWKNLQVKPGSLVVVDAGQILQRRVAFSLYVHADPGRIVAARTLVRSGVNRKGIEITTGGTPSARSYFAYGKNDGTAKERISTFFNDTNENETTLRLAPVYPVSESVMSVDPITRRISGGQFDFLNITQLGVLPQVEHSWDMESDRPVVIERAIDDRTKNDFGQSFSMSELYKEFVIPYVDPSLDNRLAFFNPGAQDAQITFEIISSGSRSTSAKSIQVKLAQRDSISMEDLGLTNVSSVLIHASHGVVVERVVASKKGVGLSISQALGLG